MYICGFGALEQFGKNASKYSKSLAGSSNIDNKEYIIPNFQLLIPHQKRVLFKCKDHRPNASIVPMLKYQFQAVHSTGTKKMPKIIQIF